MDFSDAFSNDIETLITLAPSILSPFSTTDQYADIFYEHTRSQSLLGEITASSLSSSLPFREYSASLQGAGIHVCSPTINAYHSTQGRPTKLNLEQCVPGFAPHQESTGHTLELRNPHFENHLSSKIDSISTPEKKRWIEDVLESTFSYEPALQTASLEYQDRIQWQCVINTNGHVVITRKAILGLCLRVRQQVGGRIIEAMSPHLSEYETTLFSFATASELIKNAITQVANLSNARPIRSGTLPVIFEGAPTPLLPYRKGNASIWLHETIGHLLEADQYISHACAPMGSQFTSTPVSFSDNPAHGIQNEEPIFDDEGTAGQCTPLVVEGSLQGVLTDACHAMLHELDKTGNGRRQDYRFAPQPRMSTLFMHPGTASNASLIASVQQGIYVKSVSHGLTHADTQHVHLDVREGYLIEHGRLTHPISNVTIEGKGIDILNHIEGIGNDLPAQPQMIQCKKNQQVVPVSVASPTVLIKQMNVYQHD